MAKVFILLINYVVFTFLNSYLCIACVSFYATYIQINKIIPCPSTATILLAKPIAQLFSQEENGLDFIIYLCM